MVRYWGQLKRPPVMSNPFNSGPQAPERNPPINPEYYSPNFATLQAVSSINQFQTQITTTEPNEFVVGQLVRFVLADNTGMAVLNEQTAYITALVDNENFIIAFNVVGANPFFASRNVRQISFVIPVGDVTSGQINSSGRINNLTYMPGSFINISPL